MRPILFLLGAVAGLVLLFTIASHAQAGGVQAVCGQSVVQQRVVQRVVQPVVVQRQFVRQRVVQPVFVQRSRIINQPVFLGQSLGSPFLFQRSAFAPSVVSPVFVRQPLFQFQGRRASFSLF
jgi:hypothetical protein